eukprot:1201445-Alexandrium_andersonii.AAC.1
MLSECRCPSGRARTSAFSQDTRERPQVSRTAEVRCDCHSRSGLQGSRLQPPLAAAALPAAHPELNGL